MRGDSGAIVVVDAAGKMCRTSDDTLSVTRSVEGWNTADNMDLEPDDMGRYCVAEPGGWSRGWKVGLAMDTAQGTLGVLG